MANVQRYNPFSEVVSLREAMDRLFEDSFITRPGLGMRTVHANLYETPEEFILQLPMPGVNPEDVEITAQQDTINIRWETKLTPPENAKVHWSGFQAGQFQEAFTLPQPINSDKVDARYEKGILLLHLPKAESAKARTIKISTPVSSGR